MDYCPLPWFAVRVRSQCERNVSRALREREYEEFLPLYWSRRHWSDRMKMLQLPLFAGYLFCRFDPLHRAKILATPGVVHIVGTGKTPLAIEAAEIDAIRWAVDSGQRIKPWNHVHIGDRVQIEVGPLAGLRGVLLRFKGASHVVISVQLLQRGVAVEVNEDWVTPLKKEYCGTNPLAMPPCAPMRDAYAGPGLQPREGPR